MTGSANPPIGTPTYVPYSNNMNQPSPGEDQLIDKIVEALHRNNEWAFKRYQHAVRDAHAKSHGLLYGELTVYDGLDPHLSQGLFKTPASKTPATYPVVARLSSTHPVIVSDQIRGVRAIAIKVIGVQGVRVPDTGLPGEPATTQDFVLVNRARFPFANARSYHTWGMPLASVLARSPELLLKLFTESLAAVQSVLHPFGISLPFALALFATPNTHILGETFYSAAPLRYGDYIAKISLAPLSESVTDLHGRRVPCKRGYDAITDMVTEFFRSKSAEYEVRAQLCTNLKTMPIDNAAVKWPEPGAKRTPPESVSPYCGVAKITFPIQDAGTPARRVYADDVLSFNSWRAQDS